MVRREPWIAAVPRDLHRKCKLMAELEDVTLKFWTEQVLEARLAAYGSEAYSLLNEYATTCKRRDLEEDADKHRQLVRRVVGLRYAVRVAIRDTVARKPADGEN